MDASIEHPSSVWRAPSSDLTDADDYLEPLIPSAIRAGVRARPTCARR